MPLEVQVKRNRKPIDLVWDDITLDILLSCALKESDPDLEYQEGKKFGDIEAPTYVRVSDSGVYYIDTKSPLWKQGRLVLKQEHRYEFGDAEHSGNPDRYRLIELKPGDVIEMRRSFK
jgi:hypothetical protein